MKNTNFWEVTKMLNRVVLIAAFAFTATCAYAQTAIEAVTGSVQGGVEVVRIDLSKALPMLPSGFAIQSPPRIALDFPGVSNAMGRSTIDVNQGNLKSVTIVQVADRTRVVLNLKQPASYKTEIQGKSLLVALDAVVSGVSSAVSPVVFAESRSRDSAPLRDLDFRKGADGSGRVVVSLPNNQVGVDIRQQGQSLVVEFMKSSLPEGLRRRLDVADFGTPIKTITTTQSGDKVRMIIEPTGLWEHSAYQSDEQFVVEVKEVKVDPRKLTPGTGYNGQKLSLNFQNIEVRSLLQVIADFTNFNIVTSDSVSGSVTLRLQDVPWDQALDIILQARGLGQRKSGNVLWVAPKDEIAAKEKLDLESAAMVQGLEPVKTQSFQINYAKAKEIAVHLSAGGSATSGSGTAVNARILSPRGSVIAEDRTNLLFVTDIPSKLEQVQILIARLDIAVRQVLIEARIVEATDGFSRSLGVKLGGVDLRAQKGGDGGYQVSGNDRIAFGTNYSNAVATSGAGGDVDTSGAFVSLPASGQGNFSPAAFAFSLFNASANRFLNLEISALEAEGNGKLVSSPRVVTADQKEATIEQGREVTIPGTGDNTKPEKVKGVLSLKVTPRITPEGGIILSVEVTKNSIVSRSPVEVSIKSVKTEVLVENGGTVVIGGIFELDETNNETKVPFFGDLPVVGNLFKTRSRSSAKQEMLVFLTPRVLSALMSVQ